MGPAEKDFSIWVWDIAVRNASKLISKSVHSVCVGRLKGASETNDLLSNISFTLINQ